MSPSHDDQLQCLLNRLQQGDQTAARTLVGLAYDRLRLLARHILHRGFPRFAGHLWTDSILDAAVVRLLRSLDQVRPATCPDFFNFAATQIRRELLNRARPEPPATLDVDRDGEEDRAGSRADDPAVLAQWAEAHRRIEDLPPAEQQVVNLHWWLGFTQAEVAEIMGIQPRMVSHHWVRARLKLADWLPDL
jgi:RNA polymerase sigma-70 factor (ECF subfamily)